MPRIPRRSNYARLLFPLPFLLLLTGVPGAQSSRWSVLRPTVSAARNSTVYSTAQTFEVNSTSDVSDGSCTAIGIGNGCTLREALTAANLAAGADVITFASALTSSGPATITLLSALPDFSSDITITGPGSSLLTVQRSTAGATPSFRIFTVNSGTIVSISGLTLTNGRTADGAAGTMGAKSDDGGGVLNAGNLTLTDVSIIGNRTGDGGGGLSVGGSAGLGAGIANSGTLTTTNCTISGNNGGRGGDGNSNAGDGGSGGGIFNSNTLTMTGCIVNGNNGGRGGDGGNNGGGHGGNGGGIHANIGTITLTNVTISNNVAGDNGDNGNGGFGGHGGGISIAGTNAVVIMANSAVTGNHSGSSVVGTDGFGGGIMDPGVMFITGSTISGNTSEGPGGGIMVQGAGVLKLSNSTVSGNQAQQGGGLLNDSSTILTLTNATITGNSATGGYGHGIYNYSAPTVRNSIIAGNGFGGAADLIGPSNSQGHNLIGLADPGSGFTATGDQVGTGAAPIIPLLAPLGNNGGPTPTHALLPGSRAVDAGDNCVSQPAHCGDSNISTLTTDQRGSGFNRLVNNTVDIGAFESRGFNIVASSGTPQSATVTTSFGAPLVATVSSAFSEPIAGGLAYFSAPQSGPSGSFAGGGQVAIVTVGASGVVTSPAFTANSQAGNYNVIAAATNSPFASFSLTNLAASTSTAVTSSANPVGFGQNVTFTATVTANAGIPTGSVQFKVDGSNLGVLQALNASGIATITTSALTAGTHTITADYGGDGGFPASTGSLAASQVVTPSLTINDVSITEGDSGTVNANFTVTLSASSNQAVTVNFATADGTAHTIPAPPGMTPPGSDYFSKSGQLTFAPTETTKSISVAVIGDMAFEPNETFFVNLSNPTNASISDSQGTGTINNDDAAGGTISFPSPTFTVTELAGSILVSVDRRGDTTQAVTVDYATSDITADGRKDYTPTSGTLQFDAGLGGRVIEVLVNVDAFNEGSELVLITLSNPTGGAALGAQATTTLQIDNSLWTPPPANSIDDPERFVRQHYHDFLNREASNDPDGLAFWTNQITECQQPGATCSAELRRINVSAAFFLSIEFQETGYLVYRFYKSAYGNISGTPVPLRMSEFLPDTQRIGRGVVIGRPGADQVLENNKVAYALDFVSSSRFTTAYPTTSTPAQFVDALFANGEVTPSATDRNAAIAEFGGAGNTANTSARARALRRVAENSTLKVQETNKAFVLIQYFGYLRRNPNDPPEANLDFGGYNFWLGKLNQFNGNFVDADMVKAFILSAEYRQRFGP